MSLLLRHDAGLDARFLPIMRLCPVGKLPVIIITDHLHPPRLQQLRLPQVPCSHLHELPDLQTISTSGSITATSPRFNTHYNRHLPLFIYLRTIVHLHTD